MLTDRTINPSQLAYEIGAGVRVVGPYPEDFDDEGLAGKTKVCYADGPDDQALAAAVDAHVADDEWVDPNYVPPTPPPTVEELVDQRMCAALEGANTFADFKSALLGA